MDSYDDRRVGGGNGSVGPEAERREDAPFDTGRDVGSAAAPAPLRSGVSGLSLPYQIGAVVALSIIGLIACTHLAMVFLHVAPSNTLTKQHGKVVDDWVYPEFEQNWKLFAPNPLQQNVGVHVRAEIAGADGRRTTPG